MFQWNHGVSLIIFLFFARKPHDLYANIFHLPCLVCKIKKEIANKFLFKSNVPIQSSQVFLKKEVFKKGLHLFIHLSTSLSL